MRISDWSSDVCSSDLFRRAEHIACVISGWCGQYHPIEFLQPCPPFVCPNDAVGMIGQAAHAGDLNIHGLQSRTAGRSEEHTSELQSLMRIPYAVSCLKKKKNQE